MKSDKEILAEIKRHIPSFMRNNPDACLVQAYLRGHADGVKLERQECLKMVDDLRAEAEAKLKGLYDT